MYCLKWGNYQTSSKFWSTAVSPCNIHDRHLILRDSRFIIPLSYVCHCQTIWSTSLSAIQCCSFSQFLYLKSCAKIPKISTHYNFLLFNAHNKGIILSRIFIYQWKFLQKELLQLVCNGDCSDQILVTLYKIL